MIFLSSDRSKVRQHDILHQHLLGETSDLIGLPAIFFRKSLSASKATPCPSLLLNLKQTTPVLVAQ